MSENKLNADEANLSVDLSDATQAVKENRFQDAINLLKIILKDNPENIDCLYLAAVSSRYLKHFEDSKKKGDILIVSVTPDIYVNKGPTKPFFNEKLSIFTMFAFT